MSTNVRLGGNVERPHAPVAAPQGKVDGWLCAENSCLVLSLLTMGFGVALVAIGAKKLGNVDGGTLTHKLLMLGGVAAFVGPVAGVAFHGGMRKIQARREGSGSIA